MVAAPESPEHLAEAIIKLYRDRQLGCRMAENGYRYVEENLDRPQLARQMEAVLLDVIADARPVS